MPSRELPARPNLEQLKKQAKSLLDAAQRARRRTRCGDSRFCPRSSGKSLDEIDAYDLALHDAQSAVAREHGFASWNALREEVESRTLSFDAAVDEFIRCATGGATGRADRLLALHPRHRIGHAADGAGPRRRRGRRGAAQKSSGARTAARRAAGLGAAALRLPHVACTRAIRRAWRASSRSPGVSARSARIRTPSTTGTGIPSFRGRRCGRRSAPSGTCRSRKCCSRPARIRPTASRRTSPAAAAISTRSNCCTATA